MQRSFAPELMDDPFLPDAVMAHVHRGLTRTHRFLGNISALVRLLRQDPPQRILDIGCGGGELLAEIRKQIPAEVIGVDLRVPAGPQSIPIVQANAVTEPLPKADVALAVCLIHHLPEHELEQLIRNVGASCPRFVILDLVRHRLPHTLFRLFVGPWLHPINRGDGLRSVERAFTPPELRAIVARVLEGTGARFEHTVAPFYVRQIVDLRYR